MRSDAYFSDAQVDEMTDGLTQDAAKIRYLRRLGLRVDRKPNGRPLAWRPETVPDQAVPVAAATNIVLDLQHWAAARKVTNGTKTQRR